MLTIPTIIISLLLIINFVSVKMNDTDKLLLLMKLNLKCRNTGVMMFGD
jgi:hypothetical protein